MNSIKLLGAIAGDIIGSVYERINLRTCDEYITCVCSAATCNSPLVEKAIIGIFTN